MAPRFNTMYAIVTERNAWALSLSCYGGKIIYDCSYMNYDIIQQIFAVVSGNSLKDAQKCVLYKKREKSPRLQSCPGI